MPRWNLSNFKTHHLENWRNIIFLFFLFLHYWVLCQTRVKSIVMLYSHNTNISRNIIKHNIRTPMNERIHFFIKKNISHTLFPKGWCWLCMRDELGTGTDCYIDQSSSDHSRTSSTSWLGLLNRRSLRARSPLSAAGSHFGILSPTDSNRLAIWLYYLLPLIYSWLAARSRVNILVISVCGALRETFIVVGNGIGDPSSNPGQGCLHFTLS